MAVVVKRCSCKDTPAAQYQDQTYGQGMRVCNTNLKKGAKCTICGTVHKAD